MDAARDPRSRRRPARRRRAAPRRREQPDSYEIGFTLAPEFHGQGYATEAVALLLAHVFGELGAHRVFATLDARNTASAAVLRHVGLRQESHQVEADWFKDEWTTLDGWALLASEYRAQA